MARRTSPPFRADHVGSLLRPQRLLQARDDFAAGRITAGELRSVEDQEIPEAVRMQEDVGLQSATDGEFRRASWHMDFIYALGGIVQGAGEHGGQVPQRGRGDRVHRRRRSASTASSASTTRSSPTTSPSCSRTWPRRCPS